MTGLLFATFLAKIIGASRGSVTTATVLLTRSDPSTTVLGILLIVGPSLAAIAAAIGILWYHMRGRHWAHTLLLALTACAWLAWITPAATIALAIAYGGIGLLFYRKEIGAARRGETDGSEQATIWKIVLITVVISQIVFGPVWLPPQRIEIQERPTFTGYVIEAASDTTPYSILREDTRKVVTPASSEVLAMELCSMRPSDRWFTTPLIMAITREPPTYERCPD